MLCYIFYLFHIFYINLILKLGFQRVNQLLNIYSLFPFVGSIGSLFPVPELHIPSGGLFIMPSQFGVVVVWPSPFGIFQEHIGIFQEYIRIFQEYILRFQKENIILCLETKEASICKTDFPKKKVPRTFYKEKSPIFSYEVGARPLFWWKVHN